MGISTVPSIFIAVMISVAGQLFLKKGLNAIGYLDFSTQLIGSFARVFFSPLVLLGGATYFFSLFFWVYALSKADLSFVYPFVALSHVFIILTSWFVLGENVTITRLIGVLVICGGVIIVSQS